jgi:hypothetical protein
MLTRILLIIAAAAVLQAQQPIAPTTEPVGPSRGEDKAGYNITNSFELGYRWSLVSGDLGEYRSDVNFGNGIRLLSSSFSMNSKDGHGKYFDQILLNTLGLGNDPVQTAILRVQKNGLYRYDMTWRLNNYDNPGLTVSGGLHQMDTVYHLQDHEILFFPQSHYRVRAGYSHNAQDGPALSTAQEFDANGVGLPVFLNVRRQWNEYRLGGDVEFAGLRFTVLHRWDYFKEDSSGSLNQVVSGPSIGVPSDPTVLQSFALATPVHGRNPGWLGNLVGNYRHWAVNARASYTGGHNDFLYNELATGIDRFGNAANRQIVVQGDASRPFFAGDLTFSIFPTDRITILNTTSANTLRIDGPSSYTEFFNASNFGTTINFRYLGIRRVTNTTDLNVQIKKWLGLYGGFGYTDRLIRTVEGLSLPAFPDSTSQQVYENTNTLKTGTFGVRLRFFQSLTANLEGELGRATNPLTPVSERNYHAINGRVAYRTRRLQLSTSYKQLYNINAPVPLSEFTAHSRNYTASASWSPKEWFGFDASYVKLHLDSVGGIVFFAGGRDPQTGTSLYISNVHGANLGVHASIGHRADLYFGYSLIKDTGDGRSTAVPAGVTDPVTALFDAVQTFPLTYQTPSARVSIRIKPNVRWNVGYQFYNYSEQFQIFAFYQNFHANTGYTSVLWSF